VSVTDLNPNPWMQVELQATEHSLGLCFIHSYIPYGNPNSYINPNPNPAMSDCYIQACRTGLL